MIGRLKGILEVKKPPYLLLDVAGVGYELQAPMSTIYQLPNIKEPLSLYTHLYIREDAHVLYGFYEERERTLFRLLIKISGVGPKMALSILSGIDINTLILSIEHRDIEPLVRLPGVGKKTAERLIIEMAGKLKNSFLEEGELSEKLFKAESLQPNLLVEEEAIAALIALGYKPQEARTAIKSVVNDAEEKIDSSQALIRAALQQQHVNKVT